MKRSFIFISVMFYCSVLRLKASTQTSVFTSLHQLHGNQNRKSALPTAIKLQQLAYTCNVFMFSNISRYPVSVF